jgi:hypothetical protein
MSSRTAAGQYASALRLTLRNTAAAYGYTLTVGSTIASLTSVRGKPGEGDLFLLAAGGLAAFAILEMLVQRGVGRHPGSPDTAFPFAGTLNLLSVAGALGASTGIAHAVHSSLAWLLAPMAATAVYMLLVAAQVSAVARRHAS